ncbi:MAG: hypothetical protein K5978_05460 [Campylobacter sp.]|nr:hypothetical protein [Campylobacter sp.]
MNRIITAFAYVFALYIIVVALFLAGSYIIKFWIIITLLILYFVFKSRK